MTFTKRLRDAVRRGGITCSVRIWTRPRVRVGARYHSHALINGPRSFIMRR